MKAEHKKELSEIKSTLGDLSRQLSDAKDRIEVLREDVETRYDERSDTWKESEAGETMQGEIDTLENIYNALETSCEECESAERDIEENF